jgi:hypothetical protein
MGVSLFAFPMKNPYEVKAHEYYEKQREANDNYLDYFYSTGIKGFLNGKAVWIKGLQIMNFFKRVPADSKDNANTYYYCQ